DVGQKGVAHAATEVAAAFIDSYNPMGGGGHPLTSFIPTQFSVIPARDITNLLSNRDGLGNPIRPPWEEAEHKENYSKYYRWTAKEPIGQAAIATAKKLDKLGIEVSPEDLVYTYEAATGGPGKMVRQAMKAVSLIATGKGQVEKRDIPFVGRFFKEVPAELAEYRQNQSSTVESATKQENTRVSEMRKDMQNLADELLANPDDRAALYQSALDSGRLNAESATYLEGHWKERMKGLTKDDKMLRSLGVANMARAKVIYYDVLPSLPQEEWVPYLSGLIKKGIISETVEQQLQFLRQQDQAQQN